MKKQRPKSPQTDRGRALLEGAVSRSVSLLGLFIAMYLSELLVENIVFGGAVYIAGEVWVIYARIYSRRETKRLPRGIQARGLVVFILAALLTVALVLLYPVLLSRPNSILLTALLVGFIGEQIVTDAAALRLAPRSARRRGLLLSALHGAFLAGYAALCFAAHLLFAFSPPPQLGGAYAVVIILSCAQYVVQRAEKPARPDQDRDGALDSEAFVSVRAYRIYNRMTTGVAFALNLCISSFICYMRFLPHASFGESLLMLCVWIVFIAAVTGLCMWLLIKRYLDRYDRPAIFLAGLLCWGAAALRILWPVLGEGWAASMINGALMAVSFACMLSILLAQDYEMRQVIELGVGRIDEGAYRRNTALVIDWSVLLSFLLLLMMLTAFSFIMDGRLDELEATLGMQRLFRSAMLVLPMVFVLAALVYSILQPLDRNYARKLRKYVNLRAAGEADPILEARLKKVLVSDYPRAIALKVLKPLVRPLLPCRVEGRGRVDTASGPVVFICNHLEVYGPLIAVLHSPFDFRPWVYHNMLEREAIAEQIVPGVHKVLPFLPARLRARIARWIAPVLLWILNATDPIPVFRGAVRGVIETISQSVEAMAYDDNILLFPETEYPLRGVGPFFSGFVQLGKSYYRQTGRRTTFYPVYIDRRRRRMTFGEGVTFDPDNTNAVEKDRIVDTLRGAMNAMAGVETGPS